MILRPEWLGEQGVIPEELQQRLRGLGGFRNVLVHGYVALDVERVHRFLQGHLEEFLAFADEVEAFLARAAPDPEAAA